MKQAFALILIVLAIIMFYLAYQINGLPPAITGVGFILIAMVWWMENKKAR